MTNLKWIVFLFCSIVISPNICHCYTNGDDVADSDVNLNDIDNEYIKSEKSNLKIGFNRNTTIWIQTFMFFKKNMKNCLFGGQQRHAANTQHFSESIRRNEHTESKANIFNAMPISIIFTNTWMKCFKRTAMQLIDGITNANLITLMNGVQLIRAPSKSGAVRSGEATTQNRNSKGFEAAAEETSASFYKHLQRKMFFKTLKHNAMPSYFNSDDKTIKTPGMSTSSIIAADVGATNGNILKPNHHMLESRHSSLPSTSLSSSSLSSSSSWLHKILHKINSTLTTHVLQIDFAKLAEEQHSHINYGSTSDNNHLNDNNDDDDVDFYSDNKDVGTARHRHRRNNMMLAMMFGVTAMGAIVVPVGFQFLSIVAGKALLLSKMALLLASISSLRKITSSGLHYGLYHIPEHYGGFTGGYYDRGDAANAPRYPRSQ